MEQEVLNDMEKMPIRKLAIKMSIPMVLSMISIALYGIIDSMFISKISEYTLEIISISFPIQSIITAIGLGTGIGVNSILAQTLGKKDHSRAKLIIQSGFLITFISWILIVLVFSCFSKYFYSFFSDSQEIQNQGSIYLTIIVMLSIGTLFQLLFEKVLEAYGKTKSSLAVQFSGAVINLILDPLLIFGFGVIPSMGIKGAAIATVLGQCSGMVVGLFILLKEDLIKLKEIFTIKFDKTILLDIYKVGFPAILLESVTSLITLILNKLLVNISEDAITVWGLYCQLQKFVIIIVYGFNYSMIPIIAYNWGAQKYDRIKETIKTFLVISAIVTFLGQITFVFFTKNIISIYDVSDKVLNLGIIAFRILSFGFVLAGMSLVFSAVFQAFGKGAYSLTVNLSRQLVFPLALILVLGNSFGLNGIWISFVASEIITLVIAIILYRKLRKNISVQGRNEV